MTSGGAGRTQSHGSICVIRLRWGSAGRNEQWADLIDNKKDEVGE